MNRINESRKSNCDEVKHKNTEGFKFDSLARGKNSRKTITALGGIKANKGGLGHRGGGARIGFEDFEQVSKISISEVRGKYSHS